MAFKFSDQHIEEYETQGFTVFRKIVPGSLIDELRQVTDLGRELTRKANTTQAQRIQPLEKYDIDLNPFRDFTQIAPLNDAIHRLLSDRHNLGNVERMAVLLEPGELPWATGWHRDLRDNYPKLDMTEWKENFTDINYFNQINCALYEDVSFWVVPGSHRREELEKDSEKFKGFFDPEKERCFQGPFSMPKLEGRSSIDRELLCLQYCENMPGSVRLCLDPGDFAIYRNVLWHLGNYLPYLKRATLHSTAFTPEFKGWYEKMGLFK